MTLEKIRHSASHVLAQAVQSFYPNVKLGIGPVIENGFYYDFELDSTISEKDLIKIESKMKEIIKEKQVFIESEKNKKEAINFLEEKKQTYKLELIKDLNLENYSFYQNGPFIDLCKGPHVENTKEIKFFKLLKVTGAYWKGSEKNKMLQRIYGTAFENKEDLKNYLTFLSEAKKRDHRSLGKQLDLFSIHDEIGSGLILWHPKGTLLKKIMESNWENLHQKMNYLLVQTPHIGKEGLWNTSGHLGFYRENMYDSSCVDDQEYFIKPMNCPFHILIYKSKIHSYKNLPIRYAELGTVYRYEKTGVLHGLMRARGFTQDDAHIICMKNQVNNEIKKILKLALSTLKQYGFKEISAYLSTKPGEKFVGSQEDWTISEQSLKLALEESRIPFQIDEGGGAFYGPKIDLKIKDALKREWQCSTIQFDFNLPKRFDMSFINENGEKETPFMIHRAIFGSIERFIGILIEHHNGQFPLWLAPTQITIISVSENEISYCKRISEKLKDLGYRVEQDFRKEKIGKKIKTAINNKIPYMFIIGKNEVTLEEISVRDAKENKKWKTIEEFVKNTNKN